MSVLIPKPAVNSPTFQHEVVARRISTCLPGGCDCMTVVVENVLIDVCPRAVLEGDAVSSRVKACCHSVPRMCVDQRKSGFMLIVMNVVSENANLISLGHTSTRLLRHVGINVN